MKDELHKAMRSTFLAWFKKWYESCFGKFDCKNREHLGRWSRLYKKLWYRSGLLITLHRIEEEAGAIEEIEPEEVANV